MVACDVDVIAANALSTLVNLTHGGYAEIEV